MARPAKAGRLPCPQRKASIAAAAAEVFAAKGFHGTKTKEIAERAGVSEALIFRHFPTKRDLYVAILTSQSPVPVLLAELPIYAEQRDDVQVFTHIARAIITRMPDLRFMRLMLFSALEEPELSTMFFQRHVRQFYDFLTRYIQQRMREGAFVRCDPLLAARAFMGMSIYHRLLSQLFHLPVPHASEDIVRTLVHVFLNGMRGPVSKSGRPGGKRSSASRTPTRGGKNTKGRRR